LKCEVVVNAGGIYSYEIGQLVGVHVPIIPMAHQYVITKDAGLPRDMPTMRDPSLLVYYRGESGGLVSGGYERNPAPWGLEGIPSTFNNQLLAEDWDRFAPIFEAAAQRVPDLANAEIVQLINGPEAFTPDGEFILGPSDVEGFWVAAGFCAHGIAGSGGMGRLMAEWIVNGQPELDTWEMDSRRFGPQYRSREHFALARTTEVYATYYDVKYPGHEREAGRPLRSRRPTGACATWARSLARKADGSGSTGSTPTSRPVKRASDPTAGPGDCGRRPSGPSTGPVASGPRSLTRPPSPNSTSSGPTPRPSSNDSAPTRWPSPSAP
jgi:hypothetical protein